MTVFGWRVGRRQLALAALAAICIMLFLWFWSRNRQINEPLHIAADNISRSIERLDHDGLWKYLLEADKRALQHDPQALAGLLHWYRESIAGFRPVERPSSRYRKDRHTFFVSQVLRNEAGVPVLYAPNVFRTPDGPRANIVSSLVAAGVLASHRPQYWKLPGEQLQIAAAFEVGFEVEGRKLLSIGIVGVPNDDQEGAIRTFEKLSEGYGRRRVKLEQQAARAPNRTAR